MAGLGDAVAFQCVIRHRAWLNFAQTRPQGFEIISRARSSAQDGIGRLLTGL
jgi:hypothetical protein